MDTENPLLITPGDLIRRWITPEVQEQMKESDGYGGSWLNETTYPQYGRLRMADVRRICSDILLVD